MRKFGLAVAAAGFAALIASPASASDHKPGFNGGHDFNLNIIGIAQCNQNTDTDCFNGKVDDLKFQGHRIFVPFKTKTLAVCDDLSDTGSDVGDEITVAALAGGVRILVSVDPGGGVGVLDHDATDGLGKFQLEEGTYAAYARVPGGKPNSCIELNTLICEDDFGDQVDCTGNDAHNILAGFFDISKPKGDRPKWENVTNELLPGSFLGTGNGHTGLFDFLWLVYNDGVRVLQIRLKRVD